MRLISITLSGYRQFRETVSLTFPSGLIGICGPNGVGKSKLVEAIGYALYGPRRSLLPSGDKAADILSKPESGVPLKVTLVIEINEQKFEVIRMQQSRKCTLHLVGNETPLATTAKGVTDKVIELLRLPPDAFLGTFVARQREVATLQTSSAPMRQKLVNRLIGISLVEKALELSQNHRVEQVKTFDRARAGVGDNLTSMKDRLTKHRSSLLDDEADLTRANSIWEQAQLASKDLKTTVELIQRDADQYLSKEKELVRLEEHIGTLISAISETEARIKSAENAETEVAVAKSVLKDTEGVDTEADMQDSLATLDSIRKEVAAYEKGLSLGVLPKLAEREHLNANINLLFKEREELRALIVGQERLLSATQQELKTASDDETRHSKRQLNVAQIGTAGVCDACGQSLGNSLDMALRHLENERAKAELHKIETQERLEEIQREKASLEQRQSNAHEKYAACISELTEYVPYEREQIRIEGNLETLRLRVSDTSAVVRDTPYDATIHLQTVQQRERRRGAEKSLSKYEHVASLAESARQQLALYVVQQKEKDAQQLALRDELRRLHPDPVAVETADEENRAGEAASEAARVSVREAENKVATTKARIVETEAELERAKSQWVRVEACQKQASIAQRTEDLMQNLLTEVTAEACPRIVELMEGWARSLMGPHFNCIQLSPDYRVMADNGSGLHQIEHFSGGEQTLLAVMLRVAISIYCQERVGYPPGFLILDEIFGDQDESHRTQLVQFLNEIKPNYHQILIVNHVTEVTGMLDSIITVAPMGDKTSKAVLTH